MNINNYFLTGPFSPALAALARLDSPSWLCGGCVRDLLLGRPAKDMDILVPDKALALAGELARQSGWRLVILDDEILPTARIIVNHAVQIDISQWREASLEDDLRARDFTINALALPVSACLCKPLLQSSDFIDPSGGIEHIRQKLLALAGARSLTDDPLRIMRAFRFMAELGFNWHEDMASAIDQALPGLNNISPPRLGQEWLRLLRAENTARAFERMDASKVLSRLIPGWEAGRYMKQNPCHHLPVLEHSLASLRAMEELLNQPAIHLGDLAPVLNRLEVPPELLKTACLLHDLGKPPTMKSKGSDCNSFYMHDLAGADLAAEAARQLGLGSRQAALVADLVKRHMLPHFLLEAVSRHPDKRRRLLGRFLLRHNELLHSLLLLALADDMAGLGPARPPDLETRLLAMWRDLLDIQQTPALPAPLLNGRELMDKFDLPPGPRLGALLRVLRSAQMEGRITSPEQAHALARRWLARAPEKI